MGSINRESLGTLHEKINLRIEKEDYVPTVEQSLKKYAKSANIPGFRPGMVPMGVLKKMYGQSVMNDEIIKTAGKMLEDYLKNEQISIFGEPMMLPDPEAQPMDINNPKHVNFYFEIGVKPEFEIPAIKDKAHLTRYKVIISDKLINDEIERIQLKAGASTITEQVNPESKFVYLEISEANAVKPVNTEEAKSEDNSKPAGQQVMLSAMPEKLKAQVSGLAKGDTLTFKPAEICSETELADFMKNTIHAGLENKDTPYNCIYHGAESITPHELNEELYKQVYPKDTITDEASFRQKLSEELSFEFAKIAGNKLQNEIFETLVHTTPFDIPVNFLKRWIRENNKEKRKTDEEIENEFGSFEHSLRWQLITDKLTRELGISVTAEEVKNRMMQVVMEHFGIRDLEDASFLSGYVDKLLQDKQHGENTYMEILNAKLFTALEQMLTIEEKEIEEEAFFALPDAHAHHHHH